MFKEFEVALPKIGGEDYDITKYGAVSGGKVSCTKAFAKAMDAAHSNGGGRVIVPNGIWLTGPIVLKSNVELHLSDNAVINFSKNPEEYPLIVTDYEGIKRIRAVSQISAEGAENIAITGSGLINGNGHLWRPVKQFKVTERQWNRLLTKSEYVIDSKEGGIWVPTKSIYDGRYEGEVFPDDCAAEEEALAKATPFYDYYRPVMVSLRHCKKILLEDVHFQNSAAWNIHPYFCEDLTVSHVNVNNPYFAQNGDGIDVESCNRVHIAYCDFQTGDDGICLKSGKDREARKLKVPCTNVYVHDCKVGQSHGGFVVGSEMSRGVSNVLVKNCTFIDSDIGLRFKSALGRGGVVEDIYMEDIYMSNMKNEAVIVTMDYVLNQMDFSDPVSQSTDPEDVPEFRNLYFTRCISSDDDAFYRIKPLDGYPESIHDLHFEDCVLGERK
ncbi:MAG: glycoside hydrolase family 28 protein [Lachnospiraceae bacterium]|nr:glycoside hydrolase family 28 protein [Lachnospiraceae bacterium]